MTLPEILRLGGPVLAAVGAALLVDRGGRRRRLEPPGFTEPVRRALGTTVVGITLYIAVFAALGAVGRSGETDLSGLSNWQLFALQALFVLAIAVWFALGFAGTASATEGGPSLVARFAQQLGFATPAPGREIGIGVVAGLAAWMLVLAGVLVFALILSSLAGDEFLPQAPPTVIPWIAGRPVLLRLMIALTAGVVEETFFRGFLQPRVGIVLSTALFALAHLSYDQPIMLVGITILSLFYGLLVKWRQNLLPAIVAHFLFDAIQLLIVIPAALKFLYAGEP
ncbi:MAG: lysostaphin resistance A-like protein [Thermoanaerobaculia bacterium]